MATAGLALEASSSPRGERLFAWTIFPLVPGLIGYGLVVAGERLYPHVPDWHRNLSRAG